MRRRTVLVVFLLAFPTQVVGHPVTFEDGLAFSAIYRPNQAFLHGNYSMTRHLALGLTYTKVSSPEERLHGGFASLNALVSRWNRTHSQTNIYVLGGGGYGQIFDDDHTPAYFGGLQVDFETDRFYSALMGRAFSNGDNLPYQSILRIGFAPYGAEYQALQSWLVAQLIYFPAFSDELNVTMLLRFFYRTVLWEIGADLDGRPWLQLMVHY